MFDKTYRPMLRGCVGKHGGMSPAVATSRCQPVWELPCGWQLYFLNYSDAPQSPARFCFIGTADRSSQGNDDPGNTDRPQQHNIYQCLWSVLPLPKRSRQMLCLIKRTHLSRQHVYINTYRLQLHQIHHSVCMYRSRQHVSITTYRPQLPRLV